MPKIIALLCLTLISVRPCVASAVEVREVDERRANAVGIRQIEGRHLRLFTDLPPGQSVDELPAVFDAAVRQWSTYFNIPADQTADWHMQGFLIQDRTEFAALDLLPETNPDFVNGYCQGRELWLMEQPSNYYRRHLLLHEGTHGFMYAFLGEAAPGWVMEGMAELLGTHLWSNNRLQLRTMPANRNKVPMWGRIKLIRDAQQQNKVLTIPEVLNLDRRRALSTEGYAWCWALCKFLDSHPRWQKPFRQMARAADDAKFNQHFRQQFRAAWPDLRFEWSAFVATLDYGYDAKRMAIKHAKSSQIENQADATLAADQGWQSTGWHLSAGRTYEIAAEGRYQIAHDSTPWPCEPGGVTLKYHEGQSLGMLLGVLRPVDSTKTTDFSRPLAIGLGATVEVEADAILYMRVNDSAARLSDNQGSLQVRIAPR